MTRGGGFIKASRSSLTPGVPKLVSAALFMASSPPNIAWITLNGPGVDELVLLMSYSKMLPMSEHPTPANGTMMASNLAAARTNSGFSGHFRLYSSPCEFPAFSALSSVLTAAVECVSSLKFPVQLLRFESRKKMAAGSGCQHNRIESNLFFLVDSESDSE